jgi:hypothetical protein
LLKKAYIWIIQTTLNLNVNVCVCVFAYVIFNDVSIIENICKRSQYLPIDNLFIVFSWTKHTCSDLKSDNILIQYIPFVIFLVKMYI